MVTLHCERCDKQGLELDTVAKDSEDVRGLSSDPNVYAWLCPDCRREWGDRYNAMMREFLNG